MEPVYPVYPDDVADNAPAACWAVEEHAWKEVAPTLPDEVSALLAAPVVVTAQVTSDPPQRVRHEGDA